MTATLKSNDGEAEFRIEFGTPADYATDSGFESSIFLCGQHWDGEHTFPLRSSIEGLWLRSADILALREHILRWIGQPLDRLLVEDLNGDFQLGRLPGQSVRILFGPYGETKSHLNPTVTIRFSAGVLHGEFYFITDQSCLAIFAQQLSALTPLKG
jgi:hypothetical protein